MLAEAISDAFYESYVTWIRDNHPSTTQKVGRLDVTKCTLNLIQVRQWVKSWQSHLGKRATPKDLVDVIIKKNKMLKEKANNLKDEIQEKFNLVDN